MTEHCESDRWKSECRSDPRSRKISTVFQGYQKFGGGQAVKRDSGNTTLAGPLAGSRAKEVDVAGQAVHSLHTPAARSQ